MRVFRKFQYTCGILEFEHHSDFKDLVAVEVRRRGLINPRITLVEKDNIRRRWVATIEAEKPRPVSRDIQIVQRFWRLGIPQPH